MFTPTFSFFRLLAVISLSAFASTALAQTAAVPPNSIKIDRITANVLETPQYTISGDSKRIPRPANWLEIEVEFESKADFIPELTFNFFVAVGVKKNPATPVLTGTVTYQNVIGGRGKYASIYVAPQSLYLLLGGQAVTVADVDEATVQISYQGQPLAEGSVNGTKGVWWGAMRQQAGILLKKSETPFAPLWWDRYEAIKPTP